eukprot:gene2185-4250_t
MSFPYYENWNKFEDEDEYSRPNKDLDKNGILKTDDDAVDEYMGHHHNHEEEREFFNLPEHDKMKICEDHRLMGNFLFQEGLIPKACEQYQLALSYYEYCFPDRVEEQKLLETVQYACQCNISLCYLRLNYNRQAYESASFAIDSNKNNNPKGYFRRAQANRALDNYEAALSDLSIAKDLCPDNMAIQKEMIALKRQSSNAHRMQGIMAKNALETTHKTRSSCAENIPTSVHINDPLLHASSIPTMHTNILRPQATNTTVTLDNSPIINILLPIEPLCANLLCHDEGI